jgi:hypothetical protein
MTNCSKCETSLRAGKKFCTGCGAPLAVPVSVPSPASVPPIPVAPIAKAGPAPVPSPTLKPVQAPAIAPLPASKSAPSPRHWLRIVLPAALLIFAVIVFSIAWTVFTTDGFFDFRDDEILVSWGLTILGLAAIGGAVLIFRRGRPRRR